MPIPRPGYFPVSSSEFVSCVPISACPGVSVTEVQSMYAALLRSSEDAEQRPKQLQDLLYYAMQALPDASVGSPNPAPSSLACHVWLGCPEAQSPAPSM